MDFAKCSCSGANLPRYLYPAILACLTREPLHGYGILKELAASGYFGDQPPDPTGVYRSLKNMASEGLLESRLARGGSLSNRQFSLTERGLHCLEQWAETLAAHQVFLADFVVHLNKSLSGLDQPAFPRQTPCCCAPDPSSHIPVFQSGDTS